MGVVYMDPAFFSYSSDSSVTIRGYELRSTDPAASDTGTSIFSSLESEGAGASSTETRLFTVFRFLPTSAGWGTVWRKARGENRIDLDLVFLTDTALPFWGSTLVQLSPGLQRLVIGLAAKEVFQETITDCAEKFRAWGHDPLQIEQQFADWFDEQGYTRIAHLFEQFDANVNLSECEGTIPWLDFDEVLFVYERFATHRSEFTARVDARYFSERSGQKPKNRKRAD